MRAKSAAKVLTIKSICILLICGMLSLSRRTPGQLRHRVANVLALFFTGFGELLFELDLLLHLADERRVLFEQLAILGTEEALDLLEVVVEFVEHAGDGLAVLHLPVQLGEHLVRVVDRRDRLVRAGVAHSRPGVGALRDHDAELERAEPRLRRRVGLQVRLDLLVDRDAVGPAGWRIGAALDVAREKLDAGQQAADAAHVAVAVAANLVADAVQDQGLFPKRLQRRKALLKRCELPLFIWPEVFGNDAIGGKNHHQPFSLDRRRSPTEARKIHQKRQRRGGDSGASQKLTAAGRRVDHENLRVGNGVGQRVVVGQWVVVLRKDKTRGGMRVGQAVGCGTAPSAAITAISTNSSLMLYPLSWKRLFSSSNRFSP